MPDFPWLRQIKVTFGGKSYLSDGTQSTLRISAKINKTIQSVGDLSTVTLYNLSPDMRSVLSASRRLPCTIEAGWTQGGPGVTECFKGNVVTATHTRAGADIVTTVDVVSGLEDCLTARVQKTWQPGTLVLSVISDIVDCIKPKPESLVIREIKDEKIGFKGWSAACNAKQALNMLSAEFGFSWTIADNQFRAVKDNKTINNAGTVKSPYLISVTPVYTGELYAKIATGLNFRCTYRNTLLPGDKVSVESKVDPRWNGGAHQIQKVTHSLDCWNGASFISDVSCLMDPKTVAGNAGGFGQ